MGDGVRIVAGRGARARLAAIAGALGLALAGCAEGDDAPAGSTSSSAPSAPATATAVPTVAPPAATAPVGPPLTMVERMVGPADGFTAPEASTAPVVTGGVTAPAPDPHAPAPVDLTTFALLVPAELLGRIAEGLSTPAGGLLLRTGAPESARALVAELVSDVTEAGSTVTELDGVPGGRLFAAEGVPVTVFTDGPFLYSVRSASRGEGFLAEVSRRWYERVRGRPHAG